VQNSFVQLIGLFQWVRKVNTNQVVIIALTVKYVMKTILETEELIITEILVDTAIQKQHKILFFYVKDDTHKLMDEDWSETLLDEEVECISDRLLSGQYSGSLDLTDYSLIPRVWLTSDKFNADRLFQLIKDFKDFEFSDEFSELIIEMHARDLTFKHLPFDDLMYVCSILYSYV
jgi:hypothetical protein